MRLHFLGANRQVTGSRYLLEAGGLKIMVDCGMFQERKFQARNWETSPFPVDEIDYVLLTHAHLDHVGLLPRLVAQGYDGPVISVEPTVELAEIIMRDSGGIQEEDAAYKRKRHKREGRRGPYPEIPLYTEKDAENVTPLLEGVPYNQTVKLNENVSATFYEAGHILGSACIDFDVREDRQGRRIVFSGDIGQRDSPLLNDPEVITQADYIVMESTYGDRNHKEVGPIPDQIARVVREAFGRLGNLIIPTFAMERAQELLYYIGQLINDNGIPRVPVYLDSPMAIDVTEVFNRFCGYLNEEMRCRVEEDFTALRFPELKMVRHVEDSRVLNESRGPGIILASSGMCTGGRIKHHLMHNLGRPDSTILFVGYQAEGTLGRQLLDGAREVRIHGKMWKVHARTEQIFGLSAHADRDDLLYWLGGFEQAPSRIFLTHGEESVSLSLADSIRAELGLLVDVPEYGQVFELA